MTSSDFDGSFTVPLAPGTYTLHVVLTAFAPLDREITVGTPPCETTVALTMQLASRAPGAVAPKPGVASIAPPPSTTPAPAPGAAPDAANGGRAGGFGGRGGRGGGPPRFQTLSVTETQSPNTGDATVLDLASSSRTDDPAARLLPPGFSIDATSAESIAVSGTMIEVDRTQMVDRLQALARGEFGLAEGQQFGQPGAAAFGGAGGGFAEGQLAGGAGGGRGGPGGAGGLGVIGGRGVGANRLQASATYGFGGSLLDAAPYSLNGDTPAARDYMQQSFSTTLGGPVRIPGIYNGTNRTNFNFTYSGGRNGDLFDQYATVPSAAFRSGNFSALPSTILDPSTGLPFPGNVIPTNRLDPTALALLSFIPTGNIDTALRNYRYTTTSVSNTDSFSLRITHSITKPQTGRGGRGGPGGAGGGGRGGGGQGGQAGGQAAGGQGQTARGGGTTQTPAQPGAAGAAGTGRAGQAGAAGGRGGRGNFQPPLNITMNATINYRRNDGDRLNVYPQLSGETKGSTLSAPVQVNMRAGRYMHAFSATYNRTQSTTLNNFAYRQNVSGDAGITGISQDPFDWGISNLTFSTFTALRDIAPSRRTDSSWQASYTVTRPVNTHNYRVGGSFQHSVSDSRSDSNARGSFTFTGLYTADGSNALRGSGQDFADFLLGLSQQATRQYSNDVNTIGQSVVLKGQQFTMYAQDDWRWKARWTINYGLEYTVMFPFTEANGHMVNLDANSDFTAVAPVESGQTGPYSGEYPAGLVKTDWNNLAPRVGAAWRINTRSVARFGYGLSYNTGSYSTIARQLSQQPPFFQTGTSLGTLESPLPITNAFATLAPGTITNNYGIDESYVIGLIHQGTFDYSRDLFRSWNVGATYIGTLGRHLDLLRAPNRGPDGLRIPDVQSFSWQSAEGSSYMNGVSLRVQKRQTKGVSGSASYTLSEARDNTTATSGSATVAQDNQNLDAEWALSNFDRRHQVSGNANVELPWGKNRSYLSQGGVLAGIVGGWSMSATVTVQSGTPLTARCSTCASDVARGTGGTLRADATGQAIQLSDPTTTGFYFNPLAFTVPAAGTFGNSGRNVITGPSSHQVNAQFTRDIALGGNRNVSINVVANNLLNSVNFGSVDTNVNSATFGKVLSVRGMRTMRINLRFRF